MRMGGGAVRAVSSGAVGIDLTMSTAHGEMPIDPTPDRFRKCDWGPQLAHSPMSLVSQGPLKVPPMGATVGGSDRSGPAVGVVRPNIRLAGQNERLMTQ